MTAPTCAGRVPPRCPRSIFESRVRRHPWAKGTAGTAAATVPPPVPTRRHAVPCSDRGLKPIHAGGRFSVGLHMRRWTLGDHPGRPRPPAPESALGSPGVHTDMHMSYALNAAATVCTQALPFPPNTCAPTPHTPKWPAQHDVQLGGLPAGRRALQLLARAPAPPAPRPAKARPVSAAVARALTIMTQHSRESLSAPLLPARAGGPPPGSSSGLCPL